jgi:hypothetical protein
MQINFDILIRSACVPCEPVAITTSKRLLRDPASSSSFSPQCIQAIAYPHIWDKPCVTRPIGYPAAAWPRASERNRPANPTATLYADLGRFGFTNGNAIEVADRVGLSKLAGSPRQVQTSVNVE